MLWAWRVFSLLECLEQMLACLSWEGEEDGGKHYKDIACGASRCPEVR